MDQLPVINYPYVSEVEFLKEVRNVNGKAKKKRFKQGRITSPFYFLLKIKEVENDGTLAVVFYRQDEAKNKKAAEKVFHFGKAGKYYEYIIFFDRVEGLKEGKHRYAVFFNGRLIYEDSLVVNPLNPE